MKTESERLAEILAPSLDAVTASCRELEPDVSDATIRMVHSIAAERAAKEAARLMLEKD